MTDEEGPEPWTRGAESWNLTVDVTEERPILVEADYVRLTVPDALHLAYALLEAIEVVGFPGQPEEGRDD